MTPGSEHSIEGTEEQSRDIVPPWTILAWKQLCFNNSVLSTEHADCERKAVSVAVGSSSLTPVTRGQRTALLNRKWLHFPRK